MDAFIAGVAAAKPLPGGGSVAALAGVLAAALGRMMAGLTEGREKFAAVEGQVREIHDRLAALQDELRLLIHEDAVAYGSLLKAIRQPHETESQKASRSVAIEKSIRRATETPVRTARAVFLVLECLKVLVEVGNPNVRCDAAVGAQLAYAALQGTQYNILANIRSMKDRGFAGSCRVEAADLLRRGRKLVHSIDRQAKSR